MFLNSLWNFYKNRPKINCFFLLRAFTKIKSNINWMTIIYQVLLHVLSYLTSCLFIFCRRQHCNSSKVKPYVKVYTFNKKSQALSLGISVYKAKNHSTTRGWQTQYKDPDSCPVQCAQLVGMSPSIPKGHRFNSQSGHIPSFGFHCPSGSMGGNQSISLSLKSIK